MTDDQPDYTTAEFRRSLQEVSDEREETYAQGQVCFMQACEDVSPDLPVMIRGVGWLWWG